MVSVVGGVREVNVAEVMNEEFQNDNPQEQTGNRKQRREIQSRYNKHERHEQTPGLQTTI